MQTPRFVFWMLLAVAVLQVVVYYPHAPELMAAHFDASGQADGWMSKQVFFAVDLGVIALTALIFLGFPAIRWSDRWVNLPRKEYWLAPERREETFRYLAGQMFVFGSATLVLLLLAMQWAIQANLDGSYSLPSMSMWWTLGGYLAFTTWWTVGLVRHFYEPRPNPAGPPAPDRDRGPEPG